MAKKLVRKSSPRKVKAASSTPKKSHYKMPGAKRHSACGHVHGDSCTVTVRD